MDTHDDPQRERYLRCTELVQKLFEGATLQSGLRSPDGHDGYDVLREVDEHEHVVLRIPPHPRALDGLEVLLEVLDEAPRCPDGSDGKSARPRTLQKCWEAIEMMDVEVRGAMDDYAGAKAVMRACADILEKMLERRSPEQMLRAAVRDAIANLRRGT